MFEGFGILERRRARLPCIAHAHLYTQHAFAAARAQLPERSVYSHRSAAGGRGRGLTGLKGV